MKCVILAGGLGTRISEESHIRPKPMVEIGGYPIIWHIMKIYASHGITDFIICCGYKGYVIKEYFANYFLHISDVTIDTTDNSMQVHRSDDVSWKITLVNTGQDTLTGGRIKRIESYLNDDEPFLMTYGDGVSDVNIGELVSFHFDKGRKATMTAVHPPARFGALAIDESKLLVREFVEKPKSSEALINGGFFVLSPCVLDLIRGDSTIWEKEPLESLASQSELSYFHHEGFWQPMDTLRDKQYLEELWDSGGAPWKVW